ncbi:MAG: hypothetical protein LAP85_00390 [Acidobacteriia bacterium]|nr:hypothetical protein [Terriglobia bacterium]
MSVHWILAFLLLAAGWQQGEPAPQKGSDAKTPYVEKSEKQFAFYPGGKIEISAAAPGSFKVVGWQNASVRVEIEKVFFYLAPEEAQAVSRHYPARVTNTPTSARISTSGTPKPGAMMEVNVQVYVPRERTDLSIKMIKGDLSVASLSGSIEATLEDGNIDAKDLAGYFSGITKRGDLIVELSGSSWRGYGFIAATRRGSIEFKLPVDYSAALRLETGDGKISVDFPEQMVEGELVPLPVVAKKKARSVSAPVGAGGPSIKLKTLSGDIILTGTGRKN